MTRRLDRWTTCPECGRDRVGVQPAWNSSVNYRSNPRRFVVARHWLDDKKTVCTGSRLDVPESAITFSKEVSA